jgi:hypothetical protein
MIKIYSTNVAIENLEKYFPKELIFIILEYHSLLDILWNEQQFSVEKKNQNDEFLGGINNNILDKKIYLSSTSPAVKIREDNFIKFILEQKFGKQKSVNNLFINAKNKNSIANLTVLFNFSPSSSLKFIITTFPRAKNSLKKECDEYWKYAEKYYSDCLEKRFNERFCIKDLQMRKRKPNR